MIIEVTMPVLGLTMEQGTIVGWLKEVGDQVEAGEALFMVETDKATSDAPSPAAGVLARVLARRGGYRRGREGRRASRRDGGWDRGGQDLERRRRLDGAVGTPAEWRFDGDSAPAPGAGGAR